MTVNRSEGKPKKRGPKPGEAKGNAGKGRVAGTPNKATAKAREAIAMFVDGNAHRLESWLDQIAEQDGPKAAFNCFMDVVEYHVPKLARTELTGGTDEEGKSKPVSLNFVLHQPKTDEK